jgi:hypothetical protein
MRFSKISPLEKHAEFARWGMGWSVHARVLHTTPIPFVRLDGWRSALTCAQGNITRLELLCALLVAELEWSQSECLRNGMTPPTRYRPPLWFPSQPPKD